MNKFSEHVYPNPLFSSSLTNEQHKVSIRDRLKTVFEQVEALTGPLEGAYIAGGAIASLVLGEEPKDYDIWFDDPGVYWAGLNKLMAENPQVCTNASKYAHTLNIDGQTIQLVESRMGIPEVVVPGFDFLHTQSYMKRDGTLVVDIDFIKQKKLVFVPGNFSHPVNTMQRVNKFARRGYDIPFETVRDLMIACTSLDPESIGKSDKHAGSL